MQDLPENNPLPSIEESEQFDSHSPEEVYNNLLELIETTREVESKRPSQLENILAVFEKFLTDKPTPPQSYLERFGDHVEKYDYHQIVLPDGLCDPYLSELENIAIIREDLQNHSYQALEHFLLSRNHFLFSNGHAESIFCPKPLLLLESEKRDQEVDWDCTFTLFGDGSYQSYNLENEEEENLGAFGEEVIQLNPTVIQKLVMRLPVEGHDFGHLGKC